MSHPKARHPVWNLHSCTKLGGLWAGVELVVERGSTMVKTSPYLRFKGHIFDSRYADTPGGL